MSSIYFKNPCSSDVHGRIMKFPKDSLARKYLEIALVVAAYWVVSISLVFINKYLLSNPDLKLDAPLFVTWFQCVVTIAICMLLTLLSRLSQVYNGKPLFSFTPIAVSLVDLWKVLPVSMVFVAMISFNNLCLAYVDVSFYYIGRSLTTVFNVVLSYVILHQKTSLPALICCAVILAGFFLGVDQEAVGGTFSVIGVTFGVLASMFVALNSVYIKKVLAVVRGDVALLTYYNNINAAILFPPIFLVLGEGSSLLNFTHYDSGLTFWGPMFLGGLFGFAIGYLTSLQVKVTSPLTNNISGTAKACAQTVIASTYYGESHSFLWWVSNVVLLGGSAAYTRVKQIEMVADSKQRNASVANSDSHVQEKGDVEDLQVLLGDDERDDTDDLQRKVRPEEMGSASR